MNPIRRAIGIAAALALLISGCQTVTPTTDSLVIVSQSGSSVERFDLSLFQWRKGLLIRQGVVISESARTAPRPLTLLPGGRAIVVEQREPNGGARLACVQLQGPSPPAPEAGAPPDSRVHRAESLDDVRYDTMLDADGSLLLLTRRAQSAGRPVLRVSRGEIHEINPPYVRLVLVDTASAAVRDAATQAVQPIARLAPLEWLVLTDGATPTLCVVNARLGTIADVSAWDRGAYIASAEVSPDGQRAVLAVQRLGARWNLFDLLRWERATSRLDPLVAGVYSANRANANVSPTLPLYAINDRHFAFVLTEVSEWRGKTPVDGQYHTAIIDITTADVLVRIRNPQRTLRNEVPPPYLPAGRLAALRIDRTNLAAPGGGFGDEETGGEELWSAFFMFRNGKLVDASGQAHDPRSLGPYAYSSDRAVLAVRERIGAGDRCLIFSDRKRLTTIDLGGIERLTWLRTPPSDTDP